MNRSFTIALLVLFTPSVLALRPDRVILSTDNNPMYIQFWPLVARAWHDWIGIKPTLALVADEDVIIDESVGEVIRFEPIEGIPNSFYAQVVRLLLPGALYPQETCILSDIDMLPISKIFFLRSAEWVPDDHFVVYTDQAYEPKMRQYPICYNAAKGFVFREIFQVNALEEIPGKVRDWFSFKIGWTSDEIILYGLLLLWKGNPKRVTRLGYKTGNQRIDRSRWGFDKNLLAAGYYIDAHMLRPYQKYRNQIDHLVNTVYKNPHLYN